MSKASDLRKLSQQPMTQEYFAEMREQAFGEKNDRGACLLFSANLENALDAVLTSWCFTPSEDVSPFFQSDGIFGTLLPKDRISSRDEDYRSYYDRQPNHRAARSKCLRPCQNPNRF